MKKLLAMLLALVMVLSFAACGQEETPVEPEVENPTEETPVEEEPEVTEATYTLGLGTVVSQTVGEKAQVDATFASVVLDAEGTIVAIDLDVAQSTCPKTDAGVFVTEGFDDRTKTEKGPDYGMAPVSPIGAEWDAQMAAFEAWAIGKTVDYVTGVELVEHNGHNVAMNETDLYAGCTMDITAFQAALADALNNTVEFTTAEEFKLGLGVVTSCSVKETSIEMYTDYAAVVTDANDVILAARLDAIQPKIGLEADGTTTGIEDLRSKYTKKDDYGMTVASPIAAEWYTQADAFCAYVVGKVAADLEAIELVEHNGHMVALNEADLYAGCTMQVGSYIEATVKAIGYAD
jgi:predicted small lipoprotein YifL